MDPTHTIPSEVLRLSSPPTSDELASLHAHFDDRGYVVIAGVLEPDAIEATIDELWTSPELLGGAPNEPFTAAAAVYAAPSAAGPWTELSRSMITGVWAGELAVPQNAPLVLRVEPSPGYIGAAEHVWTVPSGDAVASGVFEYTPAQ